MLAVKTQKLVIKLYLEFPKSNVAVKYVLSNLALQYQSEVFKKSLLSLLQTRITFGKDHFLNATVLVLAAAVLHTRILDLC